VLNEFIIGLTAQHVTCYGLVTKYTGIREDLNDLVSDMSDYSIMSSNIYIPELWETVSYGVLGAQAKIRSQFCAADFGSCALHILQNLP